MYLHLPNLFTAMLMVGVVLVPLNKKMSKRMKIHEIILIMRNISIATADDTLHIW